MLKQSRFIEISLDKELENGYEYMLKVNLPDKRVIYQKIKIEDVEALTRYCQENMNVI